MYLYIFCVSPVSKQLRKPDRFAPHGCGESFASARQRNSGGNRSVSHPMGTVKVLRQPGVENADKTVKLPHPNSAVKIYDAYRWLPCVRGAGDVVD